MKRAETSIITTHNLMYVGDYIRMPGDTNRIRRIVTAQFMAKNSGVVATFIRPSKGFRKHVRRTKERGER